MVPLDERSDLELEGIVQRFEYTYELAWKSLKDYLQHAGVALDPVTPRTVIREAFAAGIIVDGSVWLDMLEKRNLTSRIYSEATFRVVVESIQAQYLSAFEQLEAWLKAKVPHG